MIKHYKLEGHEPVLVRLYDNLGRLDRQMLYEWAQWLETADRQVMRTELIDGSAISTVFLGMDHSFGGGAPQLFETCLFSSVTHYSELLKREVSQSEVVERYATWGEAVDGHMAWVEKCVPPDLMAVTNKMEKGA